MKEGAILNFLRENKESFVSGEAISDDLGGFRLAGCSAPVIRNIIRTLQLIIRLSRYFRAICIFIAIVASLRWISKGRFGIAISAVAQAFQLDGSIRAFDAVGIHLDRIDRIQAPDGQMH